MKMVKIRVVQEPGDFRSVRFSKTDWETAKKIAPEKVVPYNTAREAIRNSGNLYEIVHEKPKVEVELKGAKAPEEMTAEELVAEMTAFGKPPRKKMFRKDAIDFVKKLRADAAAMIADDEEEDEQE